jgi:7-cyano-7-deazaguanine synthase
VADVTRALLLSGGMDSTCLAYWQRPGVAITVDYGQKAAAGELRAAAAVCGALTIEHLVIRADLSALGSGDLAGAAPLAMANVSEWWPYRNQMLVTLAAMKCVSVGADILTIGALRTDDAHVDGRLQFVQALDALLAMQEGGLRLEAPAIGLSAAELVVKSGIPDDVLAWAHSCHVSDYACGECRGCRKHYETLRELQRNPY